MCLGRHSTEQIILILSGAGMGLGGQGLQRSGLHFGVGKHQHLSDQGWRLESGLGSGFDVSDKEECRLSRRDSSGQGQGQGQGFGSRGRCMCVYGQDQKCWSERRSSGGTCDSQCESADTSRSKGLKLKVLSQVDERVGGMFWILEVSRVDQAGISAVARQLGSCDGLNRSG